jgi:hypothetical protein
MWIGDLFIDIGRRIEEEREYRSRGETVTVTTTAPTYAELLDENVDLQLALDAKVVEIYRSVFKEILRLPHSNNRRNPFIRVKEIIKLRDKLCS